MKKLVKGLLFTLLLVLGVMAAGCGDNKAADVQKVRIGVSSTAEEVIWQPVIDKFKEKNVAIELVVFTDYTQPNAALANKEIELNAFQHHKYLNNEIKKHGYEITAIGNTMLSALNLYSKNIHDIKDIKPGDKIAVPNDTVNFGRALSVLQAAGLIRLKSTAGSTPELNDIEENIAKIEIVQVDASQTASLLPDVAAAIINGQFAVDAGLVPDKDAIFQDGVQNYKGDDFINVIAARTEDKDKELYQEIVKAYQSEKTKEIYKKDFHGQYIPAWDR